MERPVKVLLAVAAVVGLAAMSYVLADRFFLPNGTQMVHEGLPTSASSGPAEPSQAAEPVSLAKGAFAGRAGHQASGTVTLLQVGSDHYLRFESFDMTAGSDVFLYLTPSSDPTGSGDIGDGVRLRVEGTQDGRADKRGDFNVLLPTGLDLSLYHGVGAWCDRFDVPFGTASLT